MPKSKKIKPMRKKTKKKQNILNNFIHKKLKNENIIIFDSSNKNRINYEDKDFRKFFDKLLKIINFSFEKEREYHISKGSYYY